MLLETAGTVTKVSGTSKPSGFKVRTSPVLFRTMSDNLYNDKIRAVIRELSCNAKDSHTAAFKHNLPFEIHLPTQFEPFFSVTDYGTGMRFTKGGCEACHGTGMTGDSLCYECDATGDYDAVKRLHSTYFASDKQQSNDAIGGFGLGSKSPFAYLNSSGVTGGFVVTNRYNGQTFLYNAFVGEEGLPELVMMGEPMDTPDALNGVTVSFPVNPQNIWEFENKAASVFEFFEPRPKLNKPVNINTPQYSVRTPLWGMRQGDYADTEQGDGLRAIMGCVQYAVGNIDSSRLSETQKKLFGMPIDLFFNVGELQPAASREALSLIGDTIDNILKRLDVVQSKLLEEIKKQIDACNTGWEARLKIHELSMQSGMGTLVNDAYNRGLLLGGYSNFTLGSAKVTLNELDYQHVEVVAFRTAERKSAKRAKKEPLFENATPAKRAIAYRDVASNVAKKADFDIKVDVENRVIFVINDLKTVADRYVHYMLQYSLESTKYNRALVITRRERTIPMHQAGDEALALLDHLGNPPVVKASDLKAKYEPMMKAEKTLEVVKRERSNVRVLPTYTTHFRRGNGWKKQWEKGDDNATLNDPTSLKFYVLVEKGGANVAGLPSRFSEDAGDFIRFLSRVRESDIFPEITASTPVFGVRVDSKLISDPSFISIMPFVESRIKSILTPAKEMELSLIVKPFISTWKFAMGYVAEHPHLLSVDSPFRQFALALDKAEKADRTGHRSLANLASELDINISNTADYNQAWIKVVNRNYPMLKVCSKSNYGSGTIEEKTVVVDYIRTTDERNKRLVLADVQIATEETEEEEETVNVY